MKAITDGKELWVGKGEIRTGKGIFFEDRMDEEKLLQKGLKAFDPYFIDKIKLMKRAPQIMHPRDIGLILAYTGIDRGWNIAEGGSGTGLLTAYLAKAAYPGKVYSYEIRKEHLKVAEYNIREVFNLDNVIFKNKSIFELDEKDLDMVVFDLPNPWEGVDVAYQALKTGGFFVSYLPTVNQVLHLLRALDQRFFDVKVFQNLVIEWNAKENRLRPKSKGIQHTAFVIIARKF